MIEQIKFPTAGDVTVGAVADKGNVVEAGPHRQRSVMTSLTGALCLVMIYARDCIPAVGRMTAAAVIR